MQRACRTFLCLAVLGLGGCNPIVIGGLAAPKILAQEKVNLLNSSFAAMDILVQQSQGYFPVGTPLVVSDPIEIIDTDRKVVLEHQKVGSVLGIQYLNRLTQLGYNARHGAAHANKGQGLIEGVYQIKAADLGGGQMSVSLRMKDANGKVIARHDYALPLTYDIKRYMTRGKDQAPPMPPLF